MQVSDYHATIRAALEEYTHFLAEDEKPPIIEAIAWLDTLAALDAMPQPSWVDAPDWAMWWAVDPNGWAHWFQEEPILALTINYCGWLAKTINGVQIGAELWAAEYDLRLGIDWRTLLRARPATGGGDA